MKSEQKKRVLIVEDEQSIRDVLTELFDVPGTALSTAESLPEALALVRSQPYDFIVTDLRLGGKRDGGLQVLAMAGMVNDGATVLVLTAYPDESNRQASSRLGALHFLEKPADLHAIAKLAQDAGVDTAFGRSQL